MLSVVAFHAFPAWIKGGFIGVDVFFVISGFLISSIILQNLDRDTFSFADFYARRIKRIFPALILVLVASYTFGWFALLADEYKQLGKHIAAGAGFISNIVFWNEAGYFDNSAETKPLLHLWSLGIEEQFYIIWPLLLWFAWKQKFNLLVIIVIVAAASFSLNAMGVSKDAVATFYAPQTRFWELLCGSFLAWVTLYRRGQLNSARTRLDGWISSVASRLPKVDGKVLSNVLSVLGLALLAFGFLRINEDVSFPGNWAIIPVLGAVLLIASGPAAWINRTILSNRIAVWFGLISFPLYLWHWPLLSFARIIESDVPSKSIRIVAVVLAIILAWLTYKLLENPIRSAKYGNAKVAILVLLMASIGGIGFNTYTRDGYEFRASIQGFPSYKDALERTADSDTACLDYIGKPSTLFPYCRFSKAGGSETVAVIGDSHAHVGYPGIAEYLAERNISTVLLANRACPLLLGFPIGKTDSARQLCQDRASEIIDVVLSRSDISRVFFITRGPIYFTGTEPLSGKVGWMKGAAVSIADYKAGAQNTIDKLVAGGKKVFYVTENPELNVVPEACIARPLRLSTKSCKVDKTSVMARQQGYLGMTRSLSNAVVIPSVDVFCPTNNCVVFDAMGSLLYEDDDHLSLAGSRFQVSHLLARFLASAPGAPLAQTLDSGEL